MKFSLVNILAALVLRAAHGNRLGKPAFVDEGHDDVSETAEMVQSEKHRYLQAESPYPYSMLNTTKHFAFWQYYDHFDHYYYYRPYVLWTVGDEFADYAPPGGMDGLGAYLYDNDTVRVYVSHNLQHNKGFEYTLDNGLTARGSRVSYFDIDIDDYEVKFVDLAYDILYAFDGSTATHRGQVFAEQRLGLNFLSSGRLVEPGMYTSGSGVKDYIYFTPEGAGGLLNETLGHFWALDIDGDVQGLWDIAALGRGQWENLAPVGLSMHRTLPNC